MQPNGKIGNGKYAQHILECAAIAKQVGEALGLRDDAARQACFATVCIDAKGHGVFLEPIPQDTKTPVIQPEPAAASKATKEVETLRRDEAAAEKADAQAKDIAPNPTPEQADDARRGALLTGVQSAVGLLSREGHVPPITPGGLNAYIKKEFKGREELGQLDTDEVERLVMLLSSKLDVMREKKTKATPKSADVGF